MLCHPSGDDAADMTEYGFGWRGWLPRAGTAAWGVMAVRPVRA